VDIKLYYLSNCLIPNTFLFCDENFIDLTDATVGTPNDGEEVRSPPSLLPDLAPLTSHFSLARSLARSQTLIMEECTANGHKLSDAGGLAGASVFAVIQGRENTDVVSRMNGEFYVEPATTCNHTDITFTFGDSFLKLATGLGDNVQVGVHAVRTWYKVRSTPTHNPNLANLQRSLPSSPSPALRTTRSASRSRTRPTATSRGARLSPSRTPAPRRA
jgi:hypothetical protein